MHPLPHVCALVRAEAGRLLGSLLLVLAGANGCHPETAARAPRAPAKAATCAACHAQGRQVTAPANPRLVGQHAVYLAAQLRAFREGSRKSPIMNALAQGLRDPEIDAIAAYYEALGEVATPSTSKVCTTSGEHDGR